MLYSDESITIFPVHTQASSAPCFILLYQHRSCATGSPSTDDNTVLHGQHHKSWSVSDLPKIADCRYRLLTLYLQNFTQVSLSSPVSFLRRVNLMLPRTPKQSVMPIFSQDKGYWYGAFSSRIAGSNARCILFRCEAPLSLYFLLRVHRYTLRRYISVSRYRVAW